jgi:hypothetical protein
MASNATVRLLFAWRSGTPLPVPPQQANQPLRKPEVTTPPNRKIQERFATYLRGQPPERIVIPGRHSRAPLPFVRLRLAAPGR